jgi:hypothetical protein
MKLNEVYRVTKKMSNVYPKLEPTFSPLFNENKFIPYKRRKILLMLIEQSD